MVDFGKFQISSVVIILANICVLRCGINILGELIGVNDCDGLINDGRYTTDAVGEFTADVNLCNSGTNICGNTDDVYICCIGCLYVSPNLWINSSFIFNERVVGVDIWCACGHRNSLSSNVSIKCGCILFIELADPWLEYSFGAWLN